MLTQRMRWRSLSRICARRKQRGWELLVARKYEGLTRCRETMKFSELVRLLEREGFSLIKEKGSIRYYAKAGHPHLIRVDFHGAKEVPTGTCQAILKAAGLKRK